jgi:hypothetical protein
VSSYAPRSSQETYTLTRDTRIEQHLTYHGLGDDWPSSGQICQRQIYIWPNCTSPTGPSAPHLSREFPISPSLVLLTLTLSFFQPLLHTVVLLVQLALAARLISKFNAYYEDRPGSSPSISVPQDLRMPGNAS